MQSHLQPERGRVQAAEQEEYEYYDEEDEDDVEEDVD